MNQISRKGLYYPGQVIMTSIIFLIEGGGSHTVVHGGSHTTTTVTHGGTHTTTTVIHGTHTISGGTHHTTVINGGTTVINGGTSCESYAFRGSFEGCKGLKRF